MSDLVDISVELYLLTGSLENFRRKIFLFKKGHVKNISWLMLTHKNHPLFACGPRTTATVDCTTAKTANGRVIERELLFAVTIFIRRFGKRKLESKCMSCV